MGHKRMQKPMQTLTAHRNEEQVSPFAGAGVTAGGVVGDDDIRVCMGATLEWEQDRFDELPGLGCTVSSSVAV